MHVVNHITKTRERVLANNAKLNAARARGDGSDADLELRDQGAHCAAPRMTFLARCG